MRERFIPAFLSISFAVLLIALFYNQAVMFNYYSTLSKNNAIRIVPIDGPRGQVFDRNGIRLVSNRLAFDVAVIHRELRSEGELTDFLAKTLGASRQDVERSLAKARTRPYEPVTIVEDIDKDKALLLEESTIYMPGLEIKTRSRRHYLYGDIGSHVFGYLSEVTESELEQLEEYGYRQKDLIGRSGIEKSYESRLRGVDGATLIQVDSKARQVRTLGMKEPSSGEDLYLSIDMRLEALCDKMLKERRGAIVVMDPQNGQILALSSGPTFDPNVFVKSKGSAERLRLMKDLKGRPLSNRATSNSYEPGSVFKVVIASGALETKKISVNTHFSCPGSYTLGRTRFDCWKEGGHGSQDVKDALKNSCNVFFYQTGRALGVDNIETYAKLLGFGKACGIDLPDEVSGLVPGRMWKRFYKKDNWYEGETVNYAIGQGYLLVTPLQILNMMAAVSNGGKLVKPHLAVRIGSSNITQTGPRNINLKE